MVQNALTAVVSFGYMRWSNDRENGNKHFINGIETVLEYAENLPAADVAPVVHGRWIKDNDSFQTDDYYCCYFDYTCSECGAPMRSVTTGWICTELGCGCKLDVYGNQYTDTIYSVDYWYEIDENDQGQKNIVLE